MAIKADQVRFGLELREAVVRPVVARSATGPCKRDQASGKEVAALSSMPLMNKAATKVDTVRKASEVI